MTEVEKLHGLHNTGLTMHERFSLLAQNAVGRRKRFPVQARAGGRGRTNAALIEAIVDQLNHAQKPMTPFRGRGRGRRNLRRAGSEGSLLTMPGFRRNRTNSFGHVDYINYNQKWRSSNGNLSNYAGSVNGSVHSAGSGKSHGYWLRGDANQRARVLGSGRGRTRGRSFRGRVHQGRVNRISEPAGGGAWRTRGSGRRGMRRNTGQAAEGQAVQGQPRGRGQSRGWGLRGRGRGRGRGGISRNQTPKPVPTKEELDAQLDQYMAGTKSALDKELDEYMRNAMEFD